ncbi:MAG: RNA polymerase factor sigma-54 [Proteobacteria bacterium]|nr:RNA polymerase factor sigma-54 [Pseudomonadota bacterium]
MPIELKQTTRLQTQLVITPALKQAIELLQVSRLELVDLVKKELEENPALEETQPEDESARPAEGGPEKEPLTTCGSEVNWEEYWDGHYREEEVSRRAREHSAPPPAENYARPEGLAEHLLWQLKLSPLDPERFQLGSYLIGLIDEDGYLRSSEEEVARETGADEERLRELIQLLQGFDPPGVAARSLEECLLIQIRNRQVKDPLAELILRHYLPELENGEAEKIARETGAGLPAVKRAIQFLAELDPRPGRSFNPVNPVYLVPDVMIFKLDEHSDYFVLLNEDGLPKLRLSGYCQGLLAGGQLGSGEKQYFQERMRKAVWLIRAVHQRQRTLYRVSRALVERQREFFDRGPGFFRPLALKDIAEQVGVHESTVSRAVANKYVHTPHGLYAFKAFFNRGIEDEHGGMVATGNVRKQLQKIVGAEDWQKPLTDQKLADFLRRDGVRISRRTVTKYRKLLKIPAAQERQQAYFLKEKSQPPGEGEKNQLSPAGLEPEEPEGREEEEET